MITDYADDTDKKMQVRILILRRYGASRCVLQNVHFPAVDADFVGKAFRYTASRIRVIGAIRGAWFGF